MTSSASVACALCGRVEDSVPLTWMTEFDARRGTVYYCEDCARANLRAVESKLPQEWW